MIVSIRSICYVIIVYAFYGYCTNYLILNKTNPFFVNNVCNLVDQAYLYIRTVNFELLTAEVCHSMQGQELIQITGTKIIGTLDALQKAIYLSLVDIINSGNWLIIVFILEVEVFLQLKGKLNGKLLDASKIVKTLLYTILFVCAVYWGFEGDFLDFWDAFLWLLAFVFIELNIFQWRAETQQSQTPAGV